MENAGFHCPVLLRACVQGLRIQPDGIYVDATLGRAGHASEIVQSLGPSGRLLAIDCDRAALEAAEKRLAPWRGQVTLLHGNFRSLDRLLTEAGVSQINGVLFDLGVSSPQLDDPARGFSYRSDAPLDMRMDAGQALTAAEIVNHWPQEELRRILHTYGEERYAASIAAAIVRVREKNPVTTTLQLVEIIRAAMPAKALREKQHPAKRTFQAIRIAVNDELGAIEQGLDQAISRLAPGGRLCVITFHSLEDRIAKQKFASLARGCTCPPDFPVCVCGKKPLLKSITRKPILPDAQELQDNPRARSAKLRIVEKLEKWEVLPKNRPFHTDTVSSDL